MVERIMEESNQRRQRENPECDVQLVCGLWRSYIGRLGRDRLLKYVTTITRYIYDGCPYL